MRQNATDPPRTYWRDRHQSRIFLTVMAVNLLKLAVGVSSLSHLARLQRARLDRARAAGQPGELRHFTRNTPRRADEIVSGGSIYWVIGGRIRARQRILRIERSVDTGGALRCALVFDPEIVAVDPAPHRPFQGWRYLDARDAPPDRPRHQEPGASMPPELADELRALGLL